MEPVTEQEVEFDNLSEIAKSQEPIYKEQAAAGVTANEADTKISEENLKRDLEARLNKLKGEEPSIDPEEGARAQAQEEQKPDKTPQEILAELGLKHEPKQRVLTDAQGNEQKYIQKPLSFVGKIQFLSYVGEVLDKAMSGNNALQLNSLFDVPVRGDVLSAQDFSDAQTFVQAVGKLLVYAPDFLSKCYCIWLRVPEYERDWAIVAMEESLSDEEGFDIIDTFIDQNWETLQGFFSERLPNLSKRLQARYRASQSAQ